MNIIRKLWPVLIILSVWFVFSAPYFLQGKVPYSSTYQVNHFTPWSSYSNFWGPVKNGAMPDVTSQIYPWKHLSIETYRMGEIPLWNPYSFSGTPQLANYQSAVLFPLDSLFFVFSFVDAWSLLVLLQPLLAGIFMYLYIRSLRISKIPSLIASVSCMFCGFLTVWMDYATLGYAFLFLPLGLFGIEKFYQAGKFRYGFIISLSIVLSLLSGHFQTSLYVLLLLLAYSLFKAFSTKDRKKIWSIALFFASGLLISSPQIIPAIETYTQTLRSGLFLTGGLIPFSYMPTILSPDFFGNPVTRNDWFGYYAEWNSYVGVIPFMLAIFAILRKRISVVWFYFIAGVLSLLLAYQTGLFTIIAALHVPVLATSAPNRIIAIFSFCMCVLSAFGAEYLLTLEKNKQKLVAVIILFAAIFAFLWAVVLFKLSLPLDKIQIAKSNLYLPTALFVLGSLILLLTLLKKVTKTIVLSLILVLVCLDLLRFATKWQPFDPKNLVFPEVPVTSVFQKIAGYQRVFGDFGAEDAVYYHLPSVEGYDAVYQKRYGEFIASLDDGKLTDSGRSVVQFPKNGKDTAKALNLLGISYVVHKVSDDHAIWAFPFWTYPKGQFNQIYKDNLFEVYRNTHAFPRAFLADKYTVVTDPQQILNTMFSQNTDLRSEVILEENPGVKLSSSSLDSARIISYTPDKVVIKATSKGNNLLFLSDTYYPGWKATINGKPASILRADFDFRAVLVPAGNSLVEFDYLPSSFVYSFVLVGMGIIVLVIKKLLTK